MIRIRLAPLAVALASASAVQAHDFWIQPDAYWLGPQAKTPLILQVGHGPDRQRSAIPLGRITRFGAATPEGGFVDLKTDLRPGAFADDGTLRLGAPGTYVVVLATDDHAISRLPAARFNAYLEAEGLTAALEDRARTHRMRADGSEAYSRCAKAIVQVGPPGAGSQAQVTRALGLPLEIVPEANPYAGDPAGDLPVRVMYGGRPLAGALVKLTDLDHDAEPRDERRTDADGRARFVMPRHGRWLMNVIWTRPPPVGSDAAYETVFSSLSFGFPAVTP